MGNQHPSREKRKVQRLKSLKSQGSGVALAKRVRYSLVFMET